MSRGVGVCTGGVYVVRSIQYESALMPFLATIYLWQWYKLHFRKLHKKSVLIVIKKIINRLAESYGDYSGSYGFLSFPLFFVLNFGLFSSRLRSARWSILFMPEH